MKPTFADAEIWFTESKNGHSLGLDRLPTFETFLGRAGIGVGLLVLIGALASAGATEPNGAFHVAQPTNQLFHYSIRLATNTGEDRTYEEPNLDAVFDHLERDGIAPANVIKIKEKESGQTLADAVPMKSPEKVRMLQKMAMARERGYSVMPEFYLDSNNNLNLVVFDPESDIFRIDFLAHVNRSMRRNAGVFTNIASYQEEFELLRRLRAPDVSVISDVIINALAEGVKNSRYSSPDSYTVSDMAYYELTEISIALLTNRTGCAADLKDAVPERYRTKACHLIGVNAVLKDGFSSQLYGRAEKERSELENFEMVLEKVPRLVLCKAGTNRANTLCLSGDLNNSPAGSRESDVVNAYKNIGAAKEITRRVDMDNYIGASRRKCQFSLITLIDIGGPTHHYF